MVEAKSGEASLYVNFHVAFVPLSRASNRQPSPNDDSQFGPLTISAALTSGACTTRSSRIIRRPPGVFVKQCAPTTGASAPRMYSLRTTPESQLRASPTVWASAKASSTGRGTITDASS